MKICRVQKLVLASIVVIKISLTDALSTTDCRSVLNGLSTHRVPLRRDDVYAPYALAVSASLSGPTIQPAVPCNFLATQVWPSARVAAQAVETYVKPTDIQTLCEFGCGPGLPSLTAALIGVPSVLATDVDPIALALVQQAAQEQTLASRLRTQRFDLIQYSAKHEQEVPEADLYLLSDVFESNAVARGAAQLTCHILQQGQDRATVWVFAQTDRAQRDTYLDEVRAHLNDSSLRWASFEMGPSAGAMSNLWLCDVDETKVSYC